MQCHARQIDALPNAAPFCAVATCVPTQHTRVTIAQPFVRYRVTTTEWGTGVRTHTSDRPEPVEACPSVVPSAVAAVGGPAVGFRSVGSVVNGLWSEELLRVSAKPLAKALAFDALGLGPRRASGLEAHGSCRQSPHGLSLRPKYPDDMHDMHYRHVTAVAQRHITAYI